MAGRSRRSVLPPETPGQVFGDELRRQRESLGMSLADLSGVVNYSRSQLSLVEAAERVPSQELAAGLDVAFGLDGFFSRLRALVKNGERFPDRYRRYMELEAKAVSIAEYGVMVPGLLQTPTYAEALFRASHPRISEEEVASRLEGRLARQRLLQTDAPPRFWVVLDETALRRPAGTFETMAVQLALLLPLVDTATTTIQVLPHSQGIHAETGGSLILLTLPDRSQVAYVEGSRTGALTEEPEEVADRRESLDLLRARALSPRDSASMIRAAIQEYRGYGDH